MAILLYIMAFVNLCILLLAVKVIKNKGGINFLMLFIKRKFTPLADVGMDEIEEFEAYPSTDEDVIFLGDSIIANGKWHEFFPEMACRNRGIGGNTTKHLLNRLEFITKSNPKKLFLLVGINDLLSRRNKKEIIISFKELLSLLKQNSLNTYVLGILPINRKMCDDILSPKKNVVLNFDNEEIQVLNGEIEQLCREYGLTFVDCHSNLLDKNGELRDEFTYDGVHLTFKGYLEISKTLESFVYDYDYANIVVS
jgi:lysophospholipase L1-like esterase